MTDLTLLLVGSAVYFIFSAGCYIYFRETWLKEKVPVLGTEAERRLRVINPKADIPA